MRKLIIRVDETQYHDINRIVRVCAEAGYDIQPTVAQQVWAQYSDDVCLGWLSQPKSDAALLRVVLSRTTVVE